MFVFVCWTPYQIFNAINFVLSDVEGAKGNTDIYIYHDFRNSQVISEAVKKADIFSHVYDVEIYDKKRKIWYSKFNKIKRLLMPYSTVKRYLLSDIDVRKQGYKTLVVSGNNLFAINLYNCIKDMQVYFIDDGIGTYFGDIRESVTLLYKIFDKLFKRGPLSYDVKKLYVNNKKVCNSTMSDEIVQLPAIENDSIVEAKTKEVFSYIESDLYDQKRFIYLTQPLHEVCENAAEIEEKILSAIHSSVLLRVHPRQNTEEYSDYAIDTACNLWELECVRKIKNTHTLISAFSTAQFAPKLFFDREPTIIFTYKLYKNFNTDVTDMIDMLRSQYSDPNRIIVVETLEELVKVLQKLEEKNEQ